MKKRTKGLMLFLVVMSIFGLVACGPKGESTKDTPPNTQQKETNEEKENNSSDGVEKPSKIHIMVDGSFMLPEAGQDDIVKKYKELTGIDLEITQPAHNQYYERVNLVFATGDAPDALALDIANMYKYGSNGALYDLKPLYDQSEVLRSLDANAIEAMLLDGKLYGMPKGDGNGSVTYIRKDWLDQLGLEVPTTYDEFLNMLRGFKTLGNEIIPYTSPGIIYDEYPTYIYNRFFFHDAIPEFIPVNGEWVDGMLEPEMIPALERLRDAFTEGLIDKEIITNKTSTCRDKMTSGMAGVFNYWAGQWGKTLDDNLKATDPTGEVVAMPAIKETSYIERVGFGLSVTNASKNPEGVFKYLLEFMYDKSEGQMLFTHGVEGIHYEMKNGELFKMPSKANATQAAGQVFLLTELNLNNFDDHFKIDERIVDSRTKLKQSVQVGIPVPPSAVLDKYGADVQILRKEMLVDIVYGRVSIEDGLERYKEQSKDKVAKILEELNK